MKTYEKPIVEKGNGPSTHHETHPAYGCIRVNRVSGQTPLFGSDFHHHNYISVSIHTSTLERSLSRDWHFPKKELVEVCMSEAQWATFISSANLGSGSLCTLTRFNGQLIPGIERDKKVSEKFTDELGASLDSVRDNLKLIRERLSEVKMTKKDREALLNTLSMVERGLGGSLDFIANQFRQYIEKTVEDAKIEVEAHVQSQIVKAGLDTLHNPLITKQEDV